MRLVLAIRAGSHSGREIVIEQGASIRVGRKSPAEFVFPQDLSMSRVHFSIACTGDTCLIQDLKSSNGTWVNGRRVSEAVLQEGDEITAGEVTFTVQFERDQPWVAPPAAVLTSLPPFPTLPERRSQLPPVPKEIAPPPPEPLPRAAGKA